MKKDKMFYLNKQVVYSLAAAQYCSDAAKSVSYYKEGRTNYMGYIEENTSIWPERLMRKIAPYNELYKIKANHIIKAINLINSAPISNFYYYVNMVPDQNGNQSYIVYFDWKNPIDGKRYQVSFHNFENRFEKFVKKGRKTHWDEKSSRYACYQMVQAYGLDGKS